MKILHIVRRRPRGLLRETLDRHGTSHEVTIVLTRRAAETKPTLPGRVLLLTEEGSGEPRPSGRPEISYSELLEMIFSHDRVLCW